MMLRSTATMMTSKAVASRSAVEATTRGLATKSIGGHWQPFTAHRKLKQDPKVFARADGMFY